VRFSRPPCQPVAAGIVEKIRRIHEKCTDVANGPRFQSQSGFSTASIPNSRPVGRLTKRLIPFLGLKSQQIRRFLLQSNPENWKIWEDCTGLGQIL